MLWGRAAFMAFPFSMHNIAHPAAGFKHQTHVCCNVITKNVCLLLELYTENRFTRLVAISILDLYGTGVLILSISFFTASCAM